MRNWIIVVFVTLSLVVPFTLYADECMDGDCDNGIGTGFTEDNKIYEGEWQEGMPHGKGKLYLSKGKVIEGTWDKGELVKENTGEKESKSQEE